MIKFYLMCINPNFRRIKVYLDDPANLSFFYSKILREGPVDSYGNILPVCNEELYKDESFVLLKIDTVKCPYYKKLFTEINEVSEPDVYVGKELYNYLKKNGLESKYNKMVA